MRNRSIFHWWPQTFGLSVQMSNFWQFFLIPRSYQALQMILLLEKRVLEKLIGFYIDAGNSFWCTLDMI